MSNDKRAIEFIQKSGVLNPEITMKEIAEVSAKLEAMDIDPLAAWTFISPNFIYTGDDEVNLQVTRRHRPLR